MSQYYELKYDRSVERLHLRGSFVVVDRTISLFGVGGSGRSPISLLRQRDCSTAACVAAIQQ